MSAATRPMPLGVAIRAFLCSENTEFCDQVRRRLRGTVRRAAEPEKQVLQEMEKVRGGPCMPFGLDGDEWLVAKALALDMRQSKGAGTAIFSNLSFVDAGALTLGSEGAPRYLDESAPKLEGLASWFYPRGRESLRKANASLQRHCPPTRFAAEKRLTYSIPVTRPTAAVLKRAQPTVSLLNEHFEVFKAGELRGGDVTVRVEDELMQIEVNRPEAILRISAAAQLGRWIGVGVGEEFRAYVRLRLPGSPERQLGCVVSAAELNRQLVHVDPSRILEVPEVWWKEVWGGGCRDAAALTPAAMRVWEEQELLPA